MYTCKVFFISIEILLQNHEEITSDIPASLFGRLIGSEENNNVFNSDRSSGYRLNTMDTGNGGIRRRSLYSCRAALVGPLKRILMTFKTVASATHKTTFDRYL